MVIAYFLYHEAMHPLPTYICVHIQGSFKFQTLSGTGKKAFYVLNFLREKNKKTNDNIMLD